MLIQDQSICLIQDSRASSSGFTQQERRTLSGATDNSETQQLYGDSIGNAQVGGSAATHYQLSPLSIAGLAKLLSRQAADNSYQAGEAWLDSAGHLLLLQLSWEGNVDVTGFPGFTGQFTVTMEVQFIGAELANVFGTRLVIKGKVIDGNTVVIQHLHKTCRRWRSVNEQYAIFSRCLSAHYGQWHIIEAIA